MEKVKHALGMDKKHEGANEHGHSSTTSTTGTTEHQSGHHIGHGHGHHDKTAPIGSTTSHTSGMSQTEGTVPAAGMGTMASGIDGRGGRSDILEKDTLGGAGTRGAQHDAGMMSGRETMRDDRQSGIVGGIGSGMMSDRETMRDDRQSGNVGGMGSGMIGSNGIAVHDRSTALDDRTAMRDTPIVGSSPAGPSSSTSTGMGSGMSSGIGSGMTGSGIHANPGQAVDHQMFHPSTSHHHYGEGASTHMGTHDHHKSHGTHGTHGTHESGLMTENERRDYNDSTTTGQTGKASMMDKLNPKVDADGDGKAGIMK